MTVRTSGDEEGKAATVAQEPENTARAGLFDEPGEPPGAGPRRAVIRDGQPPGHAPDHAPEPLPPDRTQAILEATKQVAALLKAGGHPFALAGGVAVHAHGGSARLQHDADFCVLPEDAEAVAATLREAGLHVYAPPEDWLLKARWRGQDIDLIHEMTRCPVTRELLDRAEVLPVDSVHMPVLSPTDLLINRVNAFSEHHCDFGAVLPIARTLREKIDWDRVREECGTAPMPDAFLYLLERLDVIGAREEEA